MTTVLTLATCLFCLTLMLNDLTFQITLVCLSSVQHVFIKRLLWARLSSPLSLPLPKIQTQKLQSLLFFITRKNPSELSVWVTLRNPLEPFP